MSSFKVVVCASSVGVLSYLLYVHYRRQKKHGISSVQVDEEKPAPCSEPGQDSNILSKRDAYLLTNLLITSSSDNEKMLQRALTTIGNKAAFTQNQNVLREVGCLSRLTALVKSCSLSLIAQDRVNTDILHSLLGAVNNLAMNEANQKELKDCIPALTLIVSWHSITDTVVTMAALQALTNLAVTSLYHSMYAESMQVVTQLALSSSAASDVRLQSMKLLVNLTANQDMALRLLAVQNPLGFVRVLDQVNNAALTLRALTVLVNLHTLIGDAVSSASDALNDLGDGDVPYTRDNSHATRHFIRPEYLRPLRLNSP